jgi:long-chain acyl-CoA synthetase
MDPKPFLDLKIAPRAVFEWAKTRGDKPRYQVPLAAGGWRAVTWSEHATEIRRVALFLQAAELLPGDRAVVFANNRVEWMSAALGIQAAGGVMVPVYPASTAAQAAYVIHHADAKVVFVDGPALFARLLERWSDLSQVRRIVSLDAAFDPAAAWAEAKGRGVAVPDLALVEHRLVRWPRALSLGAERELKDPGAFDRMMDAVALTQPGLMLYTSGTSGDPKGVPLTHRNVGVNGRDWLVCNGPIVPDDAVDLLWLPMSHIFGFGEACLGNTLGFTTTLCDPATVMQRLPEVKPDVFMSVPSVWEKLALPALAEADPARRKEKLAATTGGKLRFCLSGGAGLKREVKEVFHQAGFLIVEGYGLTECSPTLTLNRPDAFRFDTVGKPLPSVELKLAEDGEILARAESVFAGYHKDPAATREAFTEDGWFKTGDVGRFTEDGFLQIIDRKKDILVTAGGKNVPPANIEVRFSGDPLVAHAVVYGEAKRYLVAGLWPTPAGLALPPAELLASLQKSVDRVNREVASYESVKRFAIMPRPLTVEGGLLTSTLKIRRKKVYEAFRDDFEGLYA